MVQLEVEIAKKNKANYENKKIAKLYLQMAIKMIKLT